MNNIKREQQLAAFGRLLDIMDELREKCPWDKKQTIESLRILSIEEMYELAEAITQNDMQAIKEELGDILLHIVFYAKIADEQNAFDISSLIHQLCEKLIIRHPHIYGDVKVNGEEDVKQNWEAIKQRTSKKEKKGLLSGVPAALPALVKAYRMQDKAKQVGFEWENREQVWAKVEEELHELQDALKIGTDEQRKKEFGDVLFALVNYARFINVDPEAALADTNNKFYNRFVLMEEKAASKGLQLNDMTLTEMDALWNETKTIFP
jgi:XTP/dITP diphosphohydrolase